jgi:hypothetical protein
MGYVHVGRKVEGVASERLYLLVAFHSNRALSFSEDSDMDIMSFEQVRKLVSLELIP